MSDVQQPQEPIPQDALPETHSPVLDPCTSSPKVWVVPPDFSSSTEPSKWTVEVLNTSSSTVTTEKPQQAYMRIHSKDPIQLDHHRVGWGQIYFGVILPRIPGMLLQGEPVYQAPPADAYQAVAIKRLRKSIVDQALAEGHSENPYLEISRMQRYGDNVHVLGCVEALVDEANDFLYIITPRCECNLVDWIPWGQGMQEDASRTIFAQLLEDVQYLQDQGLCHRDLSPDNCMIYQGRVVLNDLAKSFLVPYAASDENSGQLMTPAKPHGKPPYLPPELVFGYPYNAYACDVWAATIILFNLLTGEILCKLPLPSDIHFRYFVMAGGVSRTPQNERTVEILMSLDEPERNTLWAVAQKCLNMSEPALELFENSLRLAAFARWSLRQLKQSPWVNGPQGMAS